MLALRERRQALVTAREPLLSRGVLVLRPGPEVLDAGRERLGIGAAPAPLPKPADVPSARAFNAYHMARVVLTIGHRRRIDGSDSFDARHYSVGVYGGIVVTDDGGF